MGVRWQVSAGRGGSFRPESVATFTGTGGSLGPEYTIASVDLPQVTFEPYTGTQTSVLLLQKKTREEMEIEQEMGKIRDYEVFMATPQAVGHDRRGEVHYLRTPEGELIEYDDTITVTRRNASGQFVTEQRQYKVREKFDQLPEVVRYFAEWIKRPERMKWLNE